MAPGVGETLRQARLAQGVGLAEIEQATKIRARFLRAIEDEQWDVLPGRAYVRAFVRTYAEFVGVDADPLVEQLGRALEPNRQDELPPEPVVQHGTVAGGLLGRLSPRLLAAIGGGVLVVFLLILGLTSGDDADQTASPPPPPPAEEGAAEPDEPPAPEPERASVSLSAIGTVWVCLVSGRGEALVNSETLSPGEERGPFRARRLLMTFGNGQIEFTAGDEPVEVPDAAEPLGFEVTAEGVEELDATERPTCV